MHKYLEAIGFNNIKTSREERVLLREVEESFTSNQIVTMPQQDLTEYRKIYGRKIGIGLCGEHSENDEFYSEYYFPYMESQTISSYADMVVDKQKDRHAYLGNCDDVRIGISLIFYLQNPIEYMDALEKGTLSRKGTSVSLSALSLGGTVLLPIMKTPKMIQHSREESRNRMMLVSAAKKGNIAAIDSLAMEDMNTYNKISKRIVKEDVLSIVDTYFIPYGIECDEYSIMGEIKEIDKFTNEDTNAELYHMVLEINEMYMELCVPVKKVVGEPEVGRRFKSVIWLQGKINFPK